MGTICQSEFTLPKTNAVFYCDGDDDHPGTHSARFDDSITNGPIGLALNYAVFIEWWS